MASKLKSTITQQEIDNSNRFRGFVNWTDIKSPNIRNQIYLMNKTGIDANNILNQRIQAKANELANTNILDYSNQYNNLPNDLKPYFQTPQSLANTPEYQKAVAQQQQFSIDYRNYSDYQIGRQMAARGGGNVFALTNDTMRQGYTDFLNNIDAWNNYKQAQFLGQGFNAYGQPVVRNEFGTWSPVDVNGNIINVSTTGPVVPASIVVNRPIVPVNTYTGPVATIDQNKLNEALKNGITMQEFMDYGKGYNLNNNYIGSAQWWNDFNRLNRV